MANSLDLDPEWGAIDLIEEVEAAFGMKIADEDAGRCVTVGDLYKLVCASVPDWDAAIGSCASSTVFYAVRRSLSQTDKRTILPDTPLASIGLSPTRVLRKLKNDTGLRFPAHHATWLGLTGGFLLVGGIVIAVIAALVATWSVSVAAAVAAVVGLSLLRLDPGKWLPEMVTVGDLVRRAVPLNSPALRDREIRPADRWTVLVSLASEYGVLKPDEIGPDTVFHRTSLNKTASL